MADTYGHAAPGTPVPGAGRGTVCYRDRSRGYSLVELLFVCAIGATLTAVAIPATADASDELRTAMAARYLSSTLSWARLEAVKRGAAFGVRFEPVADDYKFTVYIDGNANGIRTADITARIDTAVRVVERLRDKFGGTRFGLLEGAPDADGVRATGTDGVRIGTARIETVSTDGTATSGTLYVRGRRSQYAVRILGATGRVRVLQYRPGAGTWTAR